MLNFPGFQSRHRLACLSALISLIFVVFAGIAMAAPGDGSDQRVPHLWAVDEGDGCASGACKADDNRNAEEYLNLRSFYTISSWYRSALPQVVPVRDVYVDPLRYMSPLLLSLPPPVMG